ncbi:MAG: BtpA/SgcQ family protein [Phycisphaerae bacterium]|nr:BtpA/SgcQ family protein [Phycisphaerae bacterium]
MNVNVPTPRPSTVHSQRAAALFRAPRAIIGMVHVLALPGSPRASLTIDAIARRAVEESRALVDAGFDALILENMHDVPYLNRNVGPETVACMTTVAREVRSAVSVALGLQILAGANHEALAVALAANLDFIRAEGFVFASVADEGLMPTASAGPLLRYRRTIGAERVAIIADIKKKHSSHAITSDVTIAENAAAAEFFGADAIVMTGPATGQPTALGDIDAARRGCGLPIVVGSGATAGSVSTLLSRADAVIVGSDLKRDGVWSNELDPERVRAFVAAAKPKR